MAKAKANTEIELPALPSDWEVVDEGWKFLRDILDKSGEGLTIDITLEYKFLGETVAKLRKVVSSDGDIKDAEDSGQHT